MAESQGPGARFSEGDAAGVSVRELNPIYSIAEQCSHTPVPVHMRFGDGPRIV
jgi:hypothetical protein